MQYVTLGSKYQLVIPKELRRKNKDLRPGDKIAVREIEDGSYIIKPVKKSWVERTRGIAKEAWKDIDTDKYLQDLRNEWDR